MAFAPYSASSASQMYQSLIGSALYGLAKPTIVTSAVAGPSIFVITPRLTPASITAPAAATGILGPVASTAIAAQMAINIDAPWGGGCPWSSDKTEFKKLCKAAVDNPRGKERKELYGYLAECFLDADGDRDGKVGVDEFDFLIEKAASLPRRFGLAPTWQEEYGDVARRAAARKQMFASMDTTRSGMIGLEDWVRYAMDHIAGKVRTMKDTLDFQHLESRSPDDFVRYCEVALSNPHSEEYKSLYEHLFKTFVESDVEENGAIRRQQFDGLIEDAAKAPRVLGLAPSAAAAYPSEAHKVQARDQEFRAMDTSGAGLVTFSSFLGWCLNHIAGKVKSSRAGVSLQAAPQPAMGYAMPAVSPWTVQPSMACPVSGQQGMFFPASVSPYSPRR